MTTRTAPDATALHDALAGVAETVEPIFGGPPVLSNGRQIETDPTPAAMALGVVDGDISYSARIGVEGDAMTQDVLAKWVDAMVTAAAEDSIRIESSDDAAEDVTFVGTSFDVSVEDTVVGTLNIWVGSSDADDEESDEDETAPQQGVPQTDGEPASDTDADDAPTGAGSLISGEESGSAPAVQLNPAVASALGTLSGVELDVRVRLGQADLTVRELLSLAPGSVVRMGTQVGEPFPVLVNGRLAARGDLVVVNGRLGVRIRDLVSS